MWLIMQRCCIPGVWTMRGMLNTLAPATHTCTMLWTCFSALRKNGARRIRGKVRQLPHAWTPTWRLQGCHMHASKSERVYMGPDHRHPCIDRPLIDVSMHVYTCNIPMPTCMHLRSHACMAHLIQQLHMHVPSRRHPQHTAGLQHAHTCTRALAQRARGAGGKRAQIAC